MSDDQEIETTPVDGGWTYVDEDGEEVFVPDDECDHPDEGGE
jgi:hypothetical protein